MNTRGGLNQLKVMSNGGLRYLAALYLRVLCQKVNFNTSRACYFSHVLILAKYVCVCMCVWRVCGRGQVRNQTFLAYERVWGTLF